MGEQMRTPVRWSVRVFGLHSGELVLTDSELILSAAEKEVFSIPRAGWEKLQWPWYGLGATFKAPAGDKRCLVTFMPRAASFGEWTRALLEGSEWKSRLCPASTRDEGFPARIVWGIVLFCKLGLAACGILLGFGMMVDQSGTWFERIFGAAVCVSIAGYGWIAWKDSRPSG